MKIDHQYTVTVRVKGGAGKTQVKTYDLQVLAPSRADAVEFGMKRLSDMLRGDFGTMTAKAVLTKGGDQ